MKKIFELYEYAKKNNLDLSNQILNIIKNSSSESIISNNKESIIINLEELQSLIDPDAVEVDLKIDSILWEV